MAGDCEIGSYVEVSAGTGPPWRTGSCTDVWDDQGKSCAHRSVHITQLQLYPADSVYNVGYSICQHIGKALQACSLAIKSALQCYNEAASALVPPHRIILWHNVVELTFLSEFYLLWDTQQDISQWPWATPVGHRAMDLYFRLCRAPKEIDCCDVEIQRVCTFLHNEGRYLHTAEMQIENSTNLSLIKSTCGCLKHKRFASHHMAWFDKIAKLSGFSGTLTPGIAIEDTLGTSRTIPNIQPSAAQASPLSLNPLPIRSPSPNLPIIHPRASSCNLQCYHLLQPISADESQLLSAHSIIQWTANMWSTAHFTSTATLPGYHINKIVWYNDHSWLWADFATTSQ